ncbi:hypothetical protein L6164_001217 [Bauhinia variegata]|uniref:Uncharacterized protein n=1 Tax=Bauhinia variegata TaxID=167791 RepID=A0ACB9QBK8_BAUVA|nr:hypothetical protein L6164_001217 [Bauhinia variegata]
MDEHDSEEDTDTSNTFAKMIESHEKIVSPHNEDVQTINMGTEEEKKELKIVDNSEKDEMIARFKEYLDVFAWSYRDILGLDPRVVTHKIPLYPNSRPIKQKFEARVWNEQCQEAFEKIKVYLLDPPVLMPPVPEKPLILYVTVLDELMGSVLGQHDENGKKEEAIYYLSKNFTYYEYGYATIEKTCCAFVWLATRLRQYMLYHTTMLISRIDPMKFIFKKPYLSGRLAKWKIVLSEYDIVYMTKKFIKGNAIAYHLANNPIEDYQLMKFEFPDEDILVVDKEEENEKSNRWKMYFDGPIMFMGVE